MHRAVKGQFNRYGAAQRREVDWNQRRYRLKKQPGTVQVSGFDVYGRLMTTLCWRQSGDRDLD